MINHFNSKKLSIPTFLSLDFEIMEIERISDVKVEEDAGCIHYDTFQKREGGPTALSALATKCR